MSGAQVVCIGEALVVLVQEEPGPLEHAEVFRRSLGGAELNTALGLARQGVATAVLTRVGDDGFGRYAVQEARRHGLDVSGVEVDPARPTGLYVKEIGGGTGEPSDLAAGASRMLYFRSGSASTAFSPAYLERQRAVLDAARAVHVTGITPAISDGARAMCEALADRRPHRPLLSLDLNWRPRLWTGREEEGARVLLGLARRADVVLLGRGEARVVLGADDPDEVRRLLPEPRWLVVKDDGEAAVGFHGADRAAVAPVRTVPTETIGAGDAFAAGFLAALAEGAPLDACMVRAHEIAALALATTGDHVAVRAPSAAERT